MNDAIRFHPHVPNDIAGAIAWYDEVSGELANRYRTAVRKAFAAIRSPEDLDLSPVVGTMITQLRVGLPLPRQSCDARY